MNKNRIEGRYGMVSWHHTAKPIDSSLEVNAAVVQGSIERLPREASEDGMGRFQSTAKIRAAVPAMAGPSSTEESAEGIVVIEPRAMSSSMGRRIWRTRI